MGDGIAGGGDGVGSDGRGGGEGGTSSHEAGHSHGALSTHAPAFAPSDETKCAYGKHSAQSLSARLKQPYACHCSQQLLSMQDPNGSEGVE